MCKPCCFQVTSFPLLTFLLPQLPAAKVMLLAGVREPRESHFSPFFMFFCLFVGSFCIFFPLENACPQLHSEVDHCILSSCHT